MKTKILPIEVDFELNQPVLIGPEDSPIKAIIKSILIESGVVQYQCFYWVDAVYKSEWLHSVEIREA